MMPEGIQIRDDAVVLGLLMAILAFVFYTSSSSRPFWKKFYRWVPPLLLCYFLPSLLSSSGLVDPEQSGLYYLASRFLLPSSLILLTLNIDLKGVFRLGPKALVMFFAGTLSVIAGGPLALWLVSFLDPGIAGGEGPEAIWRGMATIAGSWIGGGANQAAMYEIFKPDDTIFSIMITVDVLVAEIWMAILLIGAARATRIDRFFRADTSAITDLRDKMHAFSLRVARIPSLTDVMMILAVALGFTGLAHLMSGSIAPWLAEHLPFLERFSLTSEFFWLIVLATTFGLLLSFTRMRNLEGAGASKIGTAFIYILVATIGLKMDVRHMFSYPTLFFVGLVWMAIHVLTLLIVARWIRAPFFYLAVGSKANIGGAASAPVIAAAFDPALAPVGVLLAVLGYALGTYGGWLCAVLMQWVAQ